MDTHGWLSATLATAAISSASCRARCLRQVRLSPQDLQRSAMSSGLDDFLGKAAARSHPQIRITLCNSALRSFGQRCRCAIS